jgi:predicted nucleotidyltransferase
MLTHEKIVTTVKMAAKEFPLVKASYFGSYAENRANENSDLDLLVTFTESAVSILTIIKLKQFLEERLAKSVDVIHAPIPSTALFEVEKQVEIL